MIEIDIRTLLFTLFLSKLVVAVFFIVYTLITSKRTLVLFSWAASLQAIGLLLISYRDLMPQVFTLYLANVLIFTGRGIEVVSIAKLSNIFSNRLIKSYLILIGCLDLIFIFTQLFLPTFMVFAASMIVFMITFIPGIYFTFKKGSIWIYKLIGISYLINIVFLFRAYGALTENLNLLSGGTGQIASYIISFISGMLVSVLYLLLHKEIDEQTIKSQSVKIESDFVEIEKLNEIRSKFYSVIAHDLRSPVRGIKQLAQMLSDQFETMDEVEKAYIIDLINSNSDRLQNLLENLLKWALSESGQLTIKGTSLQLRQIGNESIDFLNESLEHKKIKLENNFSGETEIFGDKDIIGTIIRNLISNAIKFSNQGGKIVLSEELNIDNCIICVEDNGIGMEENILNSLFNADTIFSTDGTNKEKGSGLGLKICQEFVKLSNGRIWVESEFGVGSKFYIQLPLKETL